MCRKKVLLLIVLLNVHSLLAQFARIADKDGFVNLRSKPDVSSNVLEKANDGDVFWCFERQGEWYPVDLERKSKVFSGYMHHSRIQFIYTLDSIPIKEVQSHKIVFQNHYARVAISTKPFIKSEHTIQYEQARQATIVVKIDNKPIWGTDGGIPNIAYSQISVKAGGNQVILPDKAIANLFEPNFSFTSVNYDKSSNSLYISSLNSDGAGGYVVMWMIKNGKYINRTVLQPF